MAFTKQETCVQAMETHPELKLSTNIKEIYTHDNYTHFLTANMYVRKHSVNLSLGVRKDIWYSEKVALSSSITNFFPLTNFLKYEVITSPKNKAQSNNNNKSGPARVIAFTAVSSHVNFNVWMSPFSTKFTFAYQKHLLSTLERVFPSLVEGPFVSLILKW